MELPPFNLRLVPAFVVVAEELHVGRAAERLFLAQSVLSRQIASLERDLGVTLFTRHPRGVALTADGAAFVDAARDILRHAGRAEAAARAVGRELTVHLGDCEPPEVVETVHAVAAAEPELRLCVLSGPQSASARTVAEGRADVGFDIADGAPGELAYAPFSRHPFGVMCSADHRIAGLTTASWSDLSGTDLVVAPPGYGDGYNRAVAAALRRFGVSCRTSEGPPLRPSFLQTAFSRGERVLVCPAFVAQPRLPGISWVPLVPEVPLEFGVVWNDRTATASTRRFVEQVACRRPVAPPEPSPVGG